MRVGSVCGCLSPELSSLTLFQIRREKEEIKSEDEINTVKEGRNKDGEREIRLKCLKVGSLNMVFILALKGSPEFGLDCSMILSQKIETNCAPLLP